MLYAPHTDKSLRRNVVSFEMGRRMGHYCIRTAESIEAYEWTIIQNDYESYISKLENLLTPIVDES